jgi:hypothetical protein
MNVAEGVALVAIMMVLRTARNILDGRELRKWKRRRRFMEIHSFNHCQVIACVLDYQTMAILFESELDEAIDRGDDQAREEIGQQVERFLKALDAFDVKLQSIMASNKVLAKKLGPVEYKEVKAQYEEWRYLFGRLRSAGNYLAAYRLTRVAVDTAE